MKSREGKINRLVNQNRGVFGKTVWDGKEERRVKQQVEKMVNLLREYDEDNRVLTQKLKQAVQENRMMSRGKGKQKERGKQSYKLVNNRKQLTQTFRQFDKNSNLSTQKTNITLNNTLNNTLTNTLNNKSLKKVSPSLLTPQQPSIAQFQPSHNFQQPTIIQINPIKVVECKTLLVSPKEKLFRRQSNESLRGIIQVKCKVVNSSNLKMIGKERLRVNTARNSLKEFSEERRVIVNEERKSEDRRVKGAKSGTKGEKSGRRKYLSLLSTRQQHYYP